MFKPIRYATYIEAEIQEMKKGSGGKRTALRLMAAMARLLETASYDDIKVLDVCKRAGTAKGTFFIHYKTKEEFIEVLMKDYIEFEHRTMPVFDGKDGSWYTTKAVGEWYEKTFSVNHGLINCMAQLSSKEKVNHDLWCTRNQRLIDRWLPLVEENLPNSAQAMELLDLALHSVGSIMDQSLFSRYGIGAVHSQEKKHKPELLMELHSLLIYRAIYGRNPEGVEFEFVGALVNA